jgi:hypothetical protein
MKQTTNTAWGALRRCGLAVLVAVAGLAAGGCANNTSPAPSHPETSATPPAGPQPATLGWASSTCQSLQPAFDQLGAPPRPDLGNVAAARQAYIDYLTKARNAAQQAIDRLPSIGPPPVDNGQQVLDNMRTQLTQLRQDLDDALAKLNQTNPNDVAATGPALSAAGDVLSALGNRGQVLSSLTFDPQLRAALEQIPECQKLFGARATTNPPTTSAQQPG